MHKSQSHEVDFNREDYVIKDELKPSRGEEKESPGDEEKSPRREEKKSRKRKNDDKDNMVESSHVQENPEPLPKKNKEPKKSIEDIFTRAGTHIYH